MVAFRIEQHRCPNHDGWELSLRRTRSDAPRDTERPRRPVLIVPGYGMNSFIFGFHPGGRSLAEHLAYRGLDVWSVDLRAQGDSAPVTAAAKRRPTDGFGLAELATIDLTAALDHVRDATHADRVDVIGASLGATIVFTHLALVGDGLLGRIVSLGGPLRWERVHPLVAVAFKSPALAGAVPFRGTRRMAGLLLPVLMRVPKLLSIYVNATTSDLSRASEMINTVADPIPRINREIAEWIAARDLILQGVNVTDAVRTSDRPLLCVVASADGVVPAETARSSYDLTASKDKTLLDVGDAEHRYAHADLFIGREAEQRVFEPIAAWLLRP